MRLFYTTVSPYTRKVRVTAIEKGVADRITLQLCNPHEFDAELAVANPLNKVPTLVREDGSALYDSPVICAWLDSLAPEPRLIPEGGEARWDVLRTEALADGLVDAAVACVLERRRPEELQSEAVIGREFAAIHRCLDRLQSSPSTVSGPVTLAQVATGCALAYLDFRLPRLDWRKDRPELARWFAGFADRPSMQDTRPE